MRVGRVPLKRAERAAGLPNLSPALPAILVLYPGLGHRRLLPYTEVSRGAMEASQILAQCLACPLTSPGCLLEGGLKMGSQHQGILNLCLKRAPRTSCPLRCTRYRQDRGVFSCPRMEATAALPSHLPTMEGSLECCLVPHVWCLCVCAWPREVPTVGLRQPQEKNLGPRKPGCTRLQPHPQDSLGSECGARNWSRPSPSTATFASTPASLQRGLPVTEAAKQGDPVPTVESGGQAYPTLIRTDEQLRLWPLPHPSSHPVLQPAHLSSASCTSPACVCLLPPPPSVRLLPFCLPFALCSGGGLCPQLPSHHLLTLRRKISKLQDQKGNSLLPSPTFRVGPWETDLPGPPLLLIMPPSYGMHREGV